jgi:hypothetical protein
MANYLLKKIPDDLWKEFHHICVEEKETMKKRLFRLIKQDVEKFCWVKSKRLKEKS